MPKKTQEVVVRVVTPKARKPRRRTRNTQGNPTSKDKTFFEKLERAGLPPERIPKEEIQRRLREEEIGREAEVTPEEIREIGEELEEEFPTRARIRHEEQRIKRQLRRIEREAEPITRIGEAGVRVVGRLGRAITSPRMRREAGRLFAGTIPRDKRVPRARQIMRTPEKEKGILGDFGLDFFDTSTAITDGLDLGDLTVDLGLTKKKGKGMSLGEVLDIKF